MPFTYAPRGVCSQKIQVTLSDDGVIEDLVIFGGCNGNLKGLRALCLGQQAARVAQALSGIRCGPKPTSCPDQISKALTLALAELPNRK